MVYKSDDAILGFKIETAFAESPSQAAQTTWLGIIPNADFNEEVEWSEHRTINGTRDRFIEAAGKINVSGTIPIEVQNGRILYLAMGSATETNDGIGNYTHTITGGTTIPSICIEVMYNGTADFLRYYTGVKVDSLELEAVEGAEMKGSLTLLCSKSAKSTNTQSTISSVTTVPFMYYQGAITIDGYADFDVTTWKWKITNNLKPRFTIRSTDGQFAKLIIEEKREYEMSANIIIPDVGTYNTKIYDMLMAGTKFTTTLVVTRTAATDLMTLSATNCIIKNAPHNLPEVGSEIEVSVTFSPRACTWTVIDQISTYK
jgi:hypothetical protein